MYFCTSNIILYYTAVVYHHLFLFYYRINSTVSDLDPPAIQFHTDFINELEIQVQRQPDSNWCTKTRLNETLMYIRNYYAYNSGKLYVDLRNYLYRESEMLDYYMNTDMSEQSDEISCIRNMLEITMALMRRNRIDTSNLVNEYEQLKLRINNYNQTTTNWQCALETTAVEMRASLETEMNSQMAMYQQEINQAYNKVIEERSRLGTEFQRMIQQTSEIQNLVINDHLQKWKACQQKNVNGIRSTTMINLDNLQSWFENLVDILMNTSHYVAQILSLKSQINGQENNISDFLPKLKQQADLMLVTLIKRSMVFEHQPPQVIKTSTRFQLAVRLLIGNALNTRMSNSKVLVKLVSGMLYCHDQTEYKS